jgi:hypothetical protein
MDWVVPSLLALKIAIDLPPTLKHAHWPLQRPGDIRQRFATLDDALGDVIYLGIELGERLLANVLCGVGTHDRGFSFFSSIQGGALSIGLFSKASQGVQGVQEVLAPLL